ncbi:MAG: family 20 glycosylhydrolase [Clostridia bacterium]|nr:family 20 glycosylhydrolase [Clostridia bacterium]
MIFDKRDLKFERLGYMVDCSRGAVPKVETVQKLINYLAEFGYTFLELYTEDTYEIPGEPYFGYMRGRYTAAEIAEIDSYAKSKGIELIPCIQTLAHLERIKKYTCYNGLFEIDNILNVDEDGTYELIEKMLIAVGKMFSSNRVHIGMDEAMLLGRGKLLDKYGKQSREDIMYRHLAKVAEIAEKLGMECEMWSDMLVTEGHEPQPETRALVPYEARRVPDNVHPVMWTYWKKTDAELDAFITKNKALGRKTTFAGGAHKWEGFAPNNGYGNEVTEHQIAKCLQHGVEGYMTTGWGDGAADASQFSILPTLYYTAVLAHGKKLDGHYKNKFASVVGTPYDSFMTVDRLNRPENKFYKDLSTQSFVYFYSDVLQGIADSIVQPDAKFIYTNLSDSIRKAKCGKDMRYFFATYKAFADFVAEKSTLGKKLYEAYISKEADSMKAVIKRLDSAIKLLDEFIEVYTEMWHTENKPFGFEKQQLRLGGLKLRLEYTRDKVKKFCQGKINRIEELETEHLAIGWMDENVNCDNVCCNDFNNLFSGGGLM